MLFLNFEDFALNKQETINKIFDHIQLERIEINKVDFDFRRCENNINLYKSELVKSEIEYIEKKLRKYLYF